MYYSTLRFITVFLLMAFAMTDGYAQKRGKKRPVHTRQAGIGKVSGEQPAPAVDISNPAPGAVPVPQQNTLTPEMKKTKKVVIVPAPPPPPGPDQVPPYPKR